MAEELVPKLRWIAEAGQCDCHICETAVEAADTIESLKEEVALLLSHLADVYHAGNTMADAMRSGGDKGWDDAIDLWCEVTCE